MECLCANSLWGSCARRDRCSLRPFDFKGLVSTIVKTYEPRLNAYLKRELFFRAAIDELGRMHAALLTQHLERERFFREAIPELARTMKTNFVRD